MRLQAFAKKLFPTSVVAKLKAKRESLYMASVNAALREQQLLPLYEELSTIVPDLCAQYSTFNIDTPYLETKVRAQHAFQITLVKKAINFIAASAKHNLTIVDIGDSAGTHLQYLQKLYGTFHSLSVNLDEGAVRKIRRKGLKAIHARAEELAKYDITADLFLLFELLEHLVNPIECLFGIAQNTSCKGIVITVPYVSKSRVGLHHIRHRIIKNVFAENTHIFELSPEDWKLIFQHCGWQVQFDQVYLQYPCKSFLRTTKYLWKVNDFEGFYGAFLTKNNQWSELYQSW